MIEQRPRAVPDQWQVQVQAMLQSKARVIVYSDYLSAEALRAAHLEKTEDVSATVRELLAELGPDARVCVLPEGPQTIPYVVQHAQLTSPSPPG